MAHVSTPRIAAGAPPASAVSRTDEARRWAHEALAHIADGVVILDERGRLVFSNDAAVRVVGIISVGPDPKKWAEQHGLFLPDEQTHFPADDLPANRALRGESVTGIEVFVRNHLVPHGVHVTTSASPLLDEDGKIRGVVAVFHDVTAVRARQTQLLEGEKQKRAILDNIPDIAWLKDRQGRFVAINSQFARACGRETAESVLGLTDLDIWPADLAQLYRADDEEVMRTGASKRVEEPLQDAGGTIRWIETFKTSIVSDTGEVIGTTGISRDITERKQAENALRVTNDALEKSVAKRTEELAEAQGNLVRKERLAVLGQLAGGVAHQIRNPLAAIMNATYVLKRHLLPEQHPNVEDAIRIIHDEVRHANVIITGLLDYARVRTPDRHPAALGELLERVLSADWIPEHVKIERSIEEVPTVEIDADQLHGAVFNLVRNAVEAMPDGGILRVAMHADDEHILISVSDSGPGISPQVRAHLFEPLHSTKPMGVGLGLVTARTFVEAHGGRIEHVDSATGLTGACFEIRLPRG